eukprot:816194-Prorocentrum_minimum.AAC.4
MSQTPRFHSPRYRYMIYNDSQFTTRKSKSQASRSVVQSDKNGGTVPPDKLRAPARRREPPPQALHAPSMTESASSLPPPSGVTHVYPCLERRQALSHTNARVLSTKK